MTRRSTGPDHSSTNDDGDTHAGTRRTHDRLLMAAGDLILQRGTAFSLPDLARHAGVSTATTYRYFDDIRQVFQAYYQENLADLLGRLESLVTHPDPERAFRAVCLEWVEACFAWGRQGLHIRDPRGYLQRIHEAEDSLLVRLHDVLTRSLGGLIQAKVVPRVEPEYAVFVWINLFDERAVVDLVDSYGWSSERIAQRLGDSVLGAWRSEWVADLGFPEART